MPTKNINLADHQASFIMTSVKLGRYKNASEVVRAGLRLLEQKEAEDAERLKALRRIADDSFGALDQGKFTTVGGDNVGAFFDRVDQRVRSDKHPQ